MDNKVFWRKIPRFAKYDVLRDEDHLHLILAALHDPETGIERVDKKTFILYGTTEALLYRPVKLVWKLGIELYAAFISLRRN